MSLIVVDLFRLKYCLGTYFESYYNFLLLSSFFSNIMCNIYSCDFPGIFGQFLKLKVGFFHNVSIYFI